MKAQSTPISSLDFSRLSRQISLELGISTTTGEDRVEPRAERRPACGFWLLLAAVMALLPVRIYAAGNWTPLTNQAPDNIDNLLLLSDGTVMAASGEPGAGGIGNAWYRLTPDVNGSYLNGTWSTLAPMNYARLYYSSQVLRDGRVLVAGGEY